MLKSKPFLLLIAAGVVAVAYFGIDRSTGRSSAEEDAAGRNADKLGNADTRVATFAGGCFWCMEPPFEELRGVVKAESGYTGGFKPNPTYEQVSHTETGHVEAIRVTFDPSQITYHDLLEVFWRNIDPTDAGGQFNDRGNSYKTAIFVHNEEQRQAAESSKRRLDASGRFEQSIVTPIRAAKTFYLAEDYHQDYYKKSTLTYKYYRFRSGRDAFIDRVWGEDRDYDPREPMPAPADTSTSSPDVSTKLVAHQSRQTTYSRPTQAEIKRKLTPLQYQVTQQHKTEPPFDNAYWDNKAAGIYVDVVTGEPLFSSLDKFKSGTGWPSFTRPLVSDNVSTKTDYRMIFPRTEVRSKHGDSHLGHVFRDGPRPTGLRYCLNSAALRFVPAERLADEGYEEFADLFKRPSR